MTYLFLRELIMSFELDGRTLTLTEKRMKGKKQIDLLRMGVKPYVVKYTTPTTDDTMEYVTLIEAAQSFGKYKDFTLHISQRTPQ
jgi:hypothetical protein